MMPVPTIMATQDNTVQQSFPLSQSSRNNSEEHNITEERESNLLGGGESIPRQGVATCNGKNQRRKRNNKEEVNEPNEEAVMKKRKLD